MSIATGTVRTPVTRDRIAEAALAVLDSSSDESALTMRTLAERLGVRAPSLYAHVSGIDDVIGLVHERINATIDLSTLAHPDPLEGLRLFAHDYRDAYRSHHVAATIIVTRGANADHALAVYEAVAVCLVRAGVPEQSVMPYLALLDAIALGSAIEPFAAGFLGPWAAYRVDFPVLAGALRSSDPRRVDDEGFLLGLDAFLAVVRSGAHV